MQGMFGNYKQLGTAGASSVCLCWVGEGGDEGGPDHHERLDTFASKKLRFYFVGGTESLKNASRGCIIRFSGDSNPFGFPVAGGERLRLEAEQSIIGLVYIRGNEMKV